MNDSDKTAIVAFNYYLSRYAGFQVITWTADELPEDEGDWEEFTENSIENHYGRSEGILYVWPYNEVPELPPKPVIATGPEPLPHWMASLSPYVAVLPKDTPEKKRDFSPTYHEEPRHLPPLNEGGE